MLAAIESRTKNPIDEEDIYLLATSAAYELQQLYIGFEKIVERHFEFTGVKAGPSPRYHKDLLLNALNNDLVTGKVNRDFLTDLLGFRHFVRSAYGVDLRNHSYGHASRLPGTGAGSLNIDNNFFRLRH